MTWRYKGSLTLPETNRLHLKVDGWNTIVSFWGPAYFQGRTVSFSEGKLPILGGIKLDANVGQIWWFPPNLLALSGLVSYNDPWDLDMTVKHKGKMFYVVVLNMFIFTPTWED